MRTARPARLRTRLVILVAALLTIGFVTVSVVTTLLLSGFLGDRLDQQLTAAGDRFAAALPALSADDNQFDRVPGQTAGTLGARIVRGHVVAAAVVARGRELTSPGTAARATIGTLRLSPTPRSLELPGLGSYRVTVVRGTAGDLLVTGLPTGPIEDTVTHMVRIEAVVFGAVLLATIGIGTLSVRRSLRPLERMTATAARVAELPLAQGSVALPPRVPPPDVRSEAGTLAVAFDRMLVHVEQSLRRREESEARLRRFVADASHELRTPVAGVRARAEQAARELGDGRLDELGRVLSRIDAESVRMGALVEDLLTLARLDADQEGRREPVDLTLLALEVTEDARLIAPDHHWRLDLPDEPMEVCGDPAALRQVVTNLVTNARTHTPAGTTVLVRIGRDAGAAQLLVCDDGPGILAELQPVVFDRFVHGSTAGRAGSGLGLAIVRAIVARHGGTVTVDSDPTGTRFRVSLPTSPACPQPE